MREKEEKRYKRQYGGENRESVGEQGRGGGGGKCHRGLWLAGLGRWPVACGASPLPLSKWIQTRAKGAPSLGLLGELAEQWNRGQACLGSF